MAQIILLHPAGGYWEAFRAAFNMPLNLLSIAAFLTDEYSVSIIDQRLGPAWNKRLEAELSGETICVGATSYTGPSIRNALEMCSEVKRLSNVPIVWGGIHASLAPDQTSRHPLVDAVVTSEGELVFRKLADSLARGDGFFNIQGVVTKEQGDGALAQRDFVDMDSIPTLPYHLIDVDRYLPRFQGKKTLNFQTSRGCTNRCAFCYNTAFNRNTWRAMSVDKVFEALERPINDYGVESVLFVDDNMFVDMHRGLALLEKLRKADVSWQCQGIDISTLRSMSDETLQLIAESGCSRIALGVESGSERIRKLLRKPGSGDLIIEQIKRLRKHDILVHSTFICGFPTESIEELGESVELMSMLIDANPNVRVPFMYKYFPCPGTEMFEFACERGFLPPDRLEDWNDVNADDFSPARWNFPLGDGLTEDYLDRLSFTTRFLDSKDKDYDLTAASKLLIRMYKPVARFRIKRMFFKFMPETAVMRAIMNIAVKRRVKGYGRSRNSLFTTKRMAGD